MKKIDLKFLLIILWAWLLCPFLMQTLIPCGSWAAFGEDQEIPKPEFTRTGDTITAKLLPRAKSTSVLIDFEVFGGKLLEVKGMDFEQADRPEVDHKDFKSALFVIEIGTLSPGAEAKVSIKSDFFNSSTRFWIFNQHLPTPWMDSEAQNLDRPEQVQELSVKVRDGGPFDSDRIENGRIVMIGGPKDSFWGYALGTLFIRYFGIFIVLSILMLGMILAGRIFLYLEGKTARAVSKPDPQIVPVEKPETAAKDIHPETMAAIAMALHLHYYGSRSLESVQLSLSRPTTWTQQGRGQMMGERLLTFSRGKH